MLLACLQIGRVGTGIPLSRDNKQHRKVVDEEGKLRAHNFSGHLPVWAQDGRNQLWLLAVGTVKFPSWAAFPAGYL